MRVVLRCCCLLARPSRAFVPAADLLFAPLPKSRQKALPCKTGPAGSPAMLEAQGRAELAPLRSAQTGVAKSELEARRARALGFCASRRFRRGGPEQPTAKPGSRAVDVFLYAPFSRAEERRVLRPRAQHASRTDSAGLFEQSVAARVPGGASRLEYRREPRSAAQGRGGRGELFAYFLAAQKVGRPPGRNPGMGLTRNARRHQ